MKSESLAWNADGRTALVTGANRGIGQEIARQLAEAGIAVVVGSRNLSAGQTAARALGPGVRAEQLDVSDADSVVACERRLADAGIDVDILVNNAGLYTTTSLLTIDERALDEALQANFIGAWRTARAFVPGMRARGWGRVVNVSTDYGPFAERPPEDGAYGLAKTSLNVLTRMIAAEAGARVKVNAMFPGLGGDANGRQQRAALSARGSRHDSVAGDPPRRRSNRRLLLRPPTDSMVTITRSVMIARGCVRLARHPQCWAREQRCGTSQSSSSCSDSRTYRRDAAMPARYWRTPIRVTPDRWLLFVPGAHKHRRAVDRSRVCSARKGATRRQRSGRAGAAPTGTSSHAGGTANTRSNMQAGLAVPRGKRPEIRQIRVF